MDSNTEEQSDPEITCTQTVRQKLKIMQSPPQPARHYQKKVEQLRTNEKALTLCLNILLKSVPRFFHIFHALSDRTMLSWPYSTFHSTSKQIRYVLNICKIPEEGGLEAK